MGQEEFETQEKPETMNLSERCRIAIERSYGFKVPLPKSIGSHVNEKQFV
jgi:hypothetical protein